MLRRIQQRKKEMKVLISNYRLTAMYFRGYIREYCNAQANILENKLKLMKG